MPRPAPAPIPLSSHRNAAQHGTANKYRRGCRCAPCRDGHRLKLAAMRKARSQGPVPAHVHGTTNGYLNWLCRCDRCKAVRAKSVGVQPTVVPMRGGKPWTPAEDQRLLSAKVPAFVLAVELGRTVHAVYQRRYTLNQSASKYDGFHGTPQGYWRGCRCPECKDANRLYRAAVRTRHRSEGIPDALHGTSNGYREWGCRCDSCRAAVSVAASAA